jgi:hypothetical protein
MSDNAELLKRDVCIEAYFERQGKDHMKNISKLCLLAVLAACGSQPDTLQDTAARPARSSGALFGGNSDNGGFLAFGGQTDVTGTPYCLTVSSFTEGAAVNISPCISNPNTGVESTQGFLHILGTLNATFSAHQWLKTSDATGDWYVGWRPKNLFVSSVVITKDPAHIGPWDVSSRQIRLTGTGRCMTAISNTIAAGPLQLNACTNQFSQVFKGFNMHVGLTQDGQHFLATINHQIGEAAGYAFGIGPDSEGFYAPPINGNAHPNGVWSTACDYFPTSIRGQADTLGCEYKQVGAAGSYYLGSDPPMTMMAASGVANVFVDGQRGDGAGGFAIAAPYAAAGFECMGGPSTDGHPYNSTCFGPEGPPGTFFYEIYSP